MATLVIKDQPDDLAMLYAYQAMTVLARMVWTRPYDPKLAARLKRIACPTLVMCGRQDALTPLERHEEMAARISGSRLEIVEECGHLSTMERPAETSAALARWLEP